MTIQAIPTRYAGTEFRSRLEADWAATLDDRRITWTYEPEGFVLSDGTWYSPDFYLPSASAWLEVKGAHQQRISKVEQFAADLWTESGAESTYDLAAPMVLIGHDPYPADNPIPEWIQTPGTYPVMPELPRLLGVMGPGKAYSVMMVRCPKCWEGTVIALWQPICRGCKYNHGDDDNGGRGYFDTWLGNPQTPDDMVDLFKPFVRLPRPRGR